MTAGYYIYYRIAPGQTEQAKAAVEALQREVLALTGVQGRLLRRRDDPGTWMEVYEGIVNERTFEAALAETIERQQFSRVLAPGSRRTTEAFVPF